MDSENADMMENPLKVQGNGTLGCTYQRTHNVCILQHGPVLTQQAASGTAAPAGCTCTVYETESRQHCTKTQDMLPHSPFVQYFPQKKTLPSISLCRYGTKNISIVEVGITG
jgi:hypothetical protein